MKDTLQIAREALRSVLKVGRGTSGRLILEAQDEKRVSDALYALQAEGRADETHIVEYWSKPFAEVQDHEVPHSTECDSATDAVALESKFHAIGWPARALTLTTRVERVNLTSKF